MALVGVFGEGLVLSESKDGPFHPLEEEEIGSYKGSFLFFRGDAG